MRKITAILSTFLILIMIVFTGCSSDSNATGTAKPAPVKNTISPTATVNLTLFDDTIYEESSYSIVIPKGSKLTQDGTNRYWTTGNDKYKIVASFLKLNTKVHVSEIIKDPADIDEIMKLIEQGVRVNPIKLNGEYQKLTISGKDAIKLNGSYINIPLSNIDFYLIDSSEDLLCLMIVNKRNNDEAQTKTDLEKAIKNIYDTVIVK